MAKVMANAEVTLALSEIEASILLDILNNVGGPPKGPRGAADSIRRALEEGGVKRTRRAVGNLEI